MMPAPTTPSPDSNANANDGVDDTHITIDPDFHLPSRQDRGFVQSIRRLLTPSA